MRRGFAAPGARVASALVGVVCAGAAWSATPTGLAPLETWRVAESRPAPWRGSGIVGPAAQVGNDWRIGGPRLQLPSSPICEGARHSFILLPAAALFEGVLPPPAEANARALGIPRLPTLTQRITCMNGSHDLHHIGAGRMLTAIDGRVLELTRMASDETPLAAAAALLMNHVGGEMGFTPATLQAKATWLSAGLRQRIAAWMARPKRAGDVPDIHGDPFTNSQEYPEAFAFGLTAARDAAADVPVNFSLGRRSWRVTLLLLREGGKWCVDDVRYVDGQRLRQLLN